MSKLGGKLGGFMMGLALLVPATGLASSKKKPPFVPPSGPPDPPAVIRLEEQIAQQEDRNVKNLQNYSPRVETYLQEFAPSNTTGYTPTSDAYFFGRLVYNGTAESVSLLPDDHQPKKRSLLGHLIPLHGMAPYYMNSFATDALVDARGISRDHYDYKFVRAEFLGEIRCLVFDLQPRDEEEARFKGRIWVEDKEYNVVRFNGMYMNPPRGYRYFHCDSWRENLLPGQWLPVYIYSEEEGLRVAHPRYKDKDDDNEKGDPELNFRAQTRFWGYDLNGAGRTDELTEILVEAAAPVRDNSEASSTVASPLASQRQWESESERNVLDRLEKARLLAPPGEMDKVLETVVNNLIVTNHFDNLPSVHCRVLLTLPFESFTIGHTIILSRGLIDVLPDEASLAMMLSHELAHIVLGHLPDTRYGFHDRLIASDEDLLKSLDFSHSPEEEKAADSKGMDLLRNSPYNASLGTAGMFLRAMAADFPHTPNLFGAHLGDHLGADNGQLLIRMASLMSSAGSYQPAKLDQIAALPLGSRVVVNARNGEVTLTKNKAPAPLSAREKMPFQITPLFPYLRRLNTPAAAPLTAGPANPSNDGAEKTPAAK